MSRVVLSFLFLLVSFIIVSSAQADEPVAADHDSVNLKVAKTAKPDLNTFIKEFPLLLGRSISYRINPTFKVGVQPGKTTRFKMTVRF